MVYTGSSHYFHIVIQKLFEDITQVHIKIDDLLVEVELQEEAIPIFRMNISLGIIIILQDIPEPCSAERVEQ